MFKGIISVLLIFCLITAETAFCPAEAQVGSRSYLYAGSTQIYTHNVDRTGGNLTQVCPDYYEIASDGTLKHTRPVDQTFVSNMRQRGIAVMPFVSNHWNREYGRKAMANRDVLTSQLAEQVRLHNFDGLDIDIENLNQDDRDSFTAFIKLLRQRLPAGKRLSVCVAANPWGITAGWHGSYDYAALGQLVDEMLIMTYDEHYQGGEPGAVASYSFIANSVEAAKRLVPPHKLLLGIPFYGRYWKQGESYGGKAFTLSDIGLMTAAYPSVIWYNADQDCARAQVTVRAQDLEAGLWGDKTLTAGVYEIWYEDATSLAKKLGLARSAGILGAGSWALGQEPEWVWEHYRCWLQGLPFADIEGHWAERYILQLHEKALVTGHNNRFNPNSSITRAELTVMLCRLLNIAAQVNGESGFTDTRGHWADGYLAAMRQYNIVGGVGGGRFEPDRPITRQEVAALFARVLNVPDNIDFGEKKFPDVSPQTNPWANNAILTLSIYNVLTGDEQGYFNPENKCTRAEAAKIALMVSELPLRLPVKPEPVIEPR